MFFRSLLFVPGTRTDRIEKAIASEADGVIIDLEDSVPVSEKENARRPVRDLIRETKRGNVYVRVNGLETDYTEGDLREIVKNLQESSFQRLKRERMSSRSVICSVRQKSKRALNQGQYRSFRSLSLPSVWRTSMPLPRQEHRSRD